MRLTITLIVTFLSVSLTGQNVNEFFEDTLHRAGIYSTAEYSYGSDIVSSDFINKFVEGGKITQDLKQNAFDRLSDHNRIGGDLNYRLNVEIPLKEREGRTNTSLIFGIGQRDHFDASFTEDLFKFTFDGNKRFAGETIDLKSSNFNYFKYQEIRLGLVGIKRNNEKVAKEGVVVSLIKGESHQAITIPRGNIFVEELGREIELDLNYVQNESDTSNTGFSAFNGFGITTDLFTDVFLKNGDKISFRLEDLGFIHWNNQSIENKTDSVFRYQGIFIENIFELNDSLLSDLSQDSILENISVLNQKRAYSIALPAALNLGYTKYINEKLKINLGVFHKILSNYFPLIYSNTYYYFSPAIAVKAHVSYGGYGKLNTGLAFAIAIKNRYNLFIGSNNLEAYITPKSSFTSSSYVGLKAFF